MPEPTPTLQAETLLSQQSLLAAQYMLAAQAQAQLIPHLGMPGLTSQLAASQVSGLTASQLAAQLTPQLTASQLTAPSLFLPPADPLQQMLGPEDGMDYCRSKMFRWFFGCGCFDGWDALVTNYFECFLKELWFLPRLALNPALVAQGDETLTQDVIDVAISRMRNAD